MVEKWSFLQQKLTILTSLMSLNLSLEHPYIATSVEAALGVKLDAPSSPLVTHYLTNVTPHLAFFQKLQDASLALRLRHLGGE